MENRLNEYLKTQKIIKSCVQFKTEKFQDIDILSKNSKFDEELLFHKALSNKTRLLMYKLIQKEATCNCALASIFDLSEGSITHHLKILEKAGLIIGINKGHFIHYYTKENLKNLGV